jgi:hypothetical protein
VGVGGAAAVVAGAGYGAYKVAQWWRKEPPATLNLGTVEDAVSFRNVLAAQEAENVYDHIGDKLAILPVDDTK